MKREEKIAELYLKSIGYSDVVFEPKGRRTPDFVIDKEIAIEVRRLNQFYNNMPIEKVQYNFLPKLINHITSFKSIESEESAFVGISYSRPIKFSKEVKNKVNSILKTHSLIMNVQQEYIVNDNLKITIIPSVERLNFQYNFGVSSDFNQGGFVLGNIYQSLKIIIPEKYNKIKEYKSEYENWWLVLIDFIGQGIRDNEVDDLKSSIDFDLCFDKVIIVSSIKPYKGVQL